MDKAKDKELRTENLRCELTDDEIRERADGAALKAHERDRLEDARSVQNKAMKADIDDLDVWIRQLLGEVRTRSIYRDVEVTDSADFKSGTMRTLRLDTGEIVRERALTEEEKQGKLFELEKGGKTG